MNNRISDVIVVMQRRREELDAAEQYWRLRPELPPRDRRSKVIGPLLSFLGWQMVAAGSRLVRRYDDLLALDLQVEARKRASAS